MTQLITGIGIDFPPGIAVHDIVRQMIKDNWPTVNFTPLKKEVRFTDIGNHWNTNYQISTRQLPYEIRHSTGSGNYQMVNAPVEINIWQRKVSLVRPKAIDSMVNKVSEIIQTNQRDLSTGMTAGTIATLASGMDSIRMKTEFDEPGLDTIRVNLPSPGSSIQWHSQAFADVWFFRYIA